MNHAPSVAVTTIFGERFTAIQYHDVMIDPGPVFGLDRLKGYLDQAGAGIHAVVATHAQEEHIRNTASAARSACVPVYGTAATLEAIRRPSELSDARRVFIGQPQPSESLELRQLANVLQTQKVRLDVIESPGHCSGHASLFDSERGILFAGDSFLHTVFTAPNEDVPGDDWIETLERYGKWTTSTMVGTHGYVYTVDRSIPVLPSLPNVRIQTK